MNLSNLHKKAQSLPLNTIVIAILVVIVLLIIIVTFTDSFTGSNEAIGDATSCNSANPLLKEYGSIDAKPSCDSNEEQIYTVKVSDSDKEAGDVACCAIKKSSN